MTNRVLVAPSNDAEQARLGAQIHALMTRLFPICRSLTGAGVRETLDILREHVPLEIRSVPTGTPVLDWTVPKVWNVRDAWIKDPSGQKIVDFAVANLHVVSYSTPVRTVLSLDELKTRLHSLPNHPDWIPYLTSYYRESWGFCVAHRLVESLMPGDYEVCIDATLEDGDLVWGEYVVPGTSEEEVLLSTYLCHPSLANDNLSGVALLAALAERMHGRVTKFTYRFLFIPETIGAIAWLAMNGANLSRIRHGLVATCVGDPGPLTYKRSRSGAPIDRVAELVLRDRQRPFKCVDFFPWGSDERQFSSPGFDLPIGSLMRTPYAEFPEYHTSADDLTFVTPAALGETCAAYADIVDVLEADETYVNLSPFGEPQLGRRGLYQHLGGARDQEAAKLAMFWALNLSDGRHSLSQISARSGIAFRTVRAAADALIAADLLATSLPNRSPS